MTTLFFKPLHDRVLVRPNEAKGETDGGIVLPDSARDLPQTGEVIAVGPGRTLEDGSVAPIAVSVGDTVMFDKFGQEIDLESETFRILRDQEIYGIIE